MPSKAREIYCFGLGVGLAAVLRGKFHIGLKRMLSPVAYWRYPIFPLLLQCLDAEPNHARKKILDLGSPKLPALFLALKRGHEVHATDLQDQDILAVWEVYYRCYPRKHPLGSYITSFQDARALHYPDESFDIVYALSVLEHIPENGDALALQNISRVLKRHGIAVIEVPYTFRYCEVCVNKDVYERKFVGRPVFFERCYDDDALLERIVLPSGLKLERKIVIGERINSHGLFEKIPKYFRVISWSEAIFSALNHYQLTMVQREAGKAVAPGGAMSVTLVLRKPGMPEDARSSPSPLTR
jgi:SAM-dependent methyltransferase